MIETAREYLYEGFGAIPLNADKSPDLKPGHPYLYELMKDESVEKEFNTASKIGIACGEVSDGFECIDFDAHKGEDISSIFNKYMNDDGASTIIELHNLPIIKTMSGGYHIYYRCDVIEGGRALAKWATNEGMIETRGHGQYVATIPSQGYKQIQGSTIVEIARISAEERDYLISLAENLTELNISEDKKGSGKWPDKFDTSTLWGRFKEEGYDEVVELLKDEGWKYCRTRKHDNVELWLRPNKDYTNENSMPVSATLGKYHNMFYVFSSSTPFPTEVGLTFFDVLMQLKFNGDKVATVKYLEDKYKVVDIKQETLPDNKFPVEIFPEFIQELIEDLHETAGFSRDFVSVAIISTFSSIVGRMIQLKIDSTWTTQLIFWLSIVGDTGSKKSHPLKFMMKPLKKIDVGNKRVYDTKMEEYNQFMELNENEKKKAEKIKKPSFKQFIISDFTIEALAYAHIANDRSIMIYKDELIGWLNSMGQYKGGKGDEMEKWLQLYDGGELNVRRVTSEPLLLESTNINVIGTIQPEKIAEIPKSNGALHRFLFTNPDVGIKRYNRTDSNQGLIDQYLDFMNSVYNKVSGYGNPTITTMDDEARDIFMDIDESLCNIQESKNTDALIKQYCEKMKTYSPRFALLAYSMYILSTDKLGTRVNRDHMLASKKLVKYFIRAARSLFQHNNEVADILEQDSILKGKTKAEKIMQHKKNGHTNVSIARQLKCSEAYVSKIVKANLTKT